MNKQFLFLLANTVLIMACNFDTGLTPSRVKITNNSEHNITRVVIVDADDGFMIVDERDNELIAKNGNTKTFKVRGEEISGNFIACVEAEDTLGLMCTTMFYLYHDSSKSFIWAGNDSSPEWYPIDDFPMEVL